MINIISVNCTKATMDQFYTLFSIYIYDTVRFVSIGDLGNQKHRDGYNICIINCSECFDDYNNIFTHIGNNNSFFIANTNANDINQENYYISIGFDAILSSELYHNEFENFIYLLLNKNSKLSVFHTKTDYLDSLGQKRIYDNELINLLINPQNATTVRRMRLISYYGLQKFNYFNTCCLEIIPSLDIYISDNSTQIIDNYLKLILSLVEDISMEKSFNFEYRITIIETKIIFLFYSSIKKISILLTEQIAFFEILKNRVFLNLDLCFFLGVGIPVIDIININKSYDTACSAVEACFYKSNDKSIINIYNPNVLVNPIPTPSTQKSINSILGNNITIDKFYDIFENIYFLLEKDRVSPKYVVTIISVLFNKLFFDNTAISYEAKISVYNKFTTNNLIISIASIILIGKYFQYLIMYSLQFNDISDNKNEAIIKNVKNYISKNWHKQITLKDIAENIYLNPNYLCDLFKKQTGSQIFTYLNDMRILNAKALLITTDKKIFQIGDYVGYPEAASFNRMFKKNVGITPMNYRKKYKKD